VVTDPFEALGDPNGREILRLLGAEGLAVGEIAEAMPISRPEAPFPSQPALQPTIPFAPCASRPSGPGALTRLAALNNRLH
jgi:hypothetical protein